MGRYLRICFYPHTSGSARLKAFQQRLISVFGKTESTVFDYEDALNPEDLNRVRKGMVIVATGESEAGNMPVDHVTSLSDNVVVTILDRACPANAFQKLQEKLNAMMADMAWNLTHVLIYLEPDESVTVCNWNGAIITCGNDIQLAEALIPKACRARHPTTGCGL